MAEKLYDKLTKLRDYATNVWPQSQVKYLAGQLSAPFRAYGTNITAIEAFESLTGINNVNCSVALDTTNYKTGRQSIAMTVTATGAALIQKVSAFTAVDMSNKKRLRVRYYVPTGTVTTPLVWMYSGGGTGSRSAALTQGGAGWHEDDILPTLTGGTGSWDATNVTGVGFQYTGATGTQVVVDKVEIVAPSGLPTFLFTLDDGFTDHYTVAAPYFEKYGWRGFFAIIANAVGTTNYMTLAQIKELDARGHLIGNHSLSHLNWSVQAATLAAREAEIYGGRKYLMTNDLSRGADVFTVPFGFYGDQDTMDMVFRHAKCLLNTNQNYRWPAVNGLDRLNMQGVTHPDRRVLTRYVQDFSGAGNAFDSTNIDAAIAAKATCAVMIHAIDGSSQRMTPAQFRTACDYLRTKEVAGECRVVTMDEWLLGF